MTSPLNRVGARSGALTTATSVSIFDTARGIQDCTFRFDLVQASTGRVLRTLTPYTVATLSHDTTKTIKRQLSLSLGVKDSAAVDVIADRVKVYLIDYQGTAWPLGRYMFSTNSRQETTSGELSNPALMDEEFIIDQPMEIAFPPVDANLEIDSLIVQKMADFPTINYQIEGTPYSSITSWAFGTSSFQVISNLATQGAYFPPWMGNDSLMHMIRAFDPAARIPDLDWDRYSHVFSESVTKDDDLLTAPNRFIVVSNSASGSADNGGPIIGSYDIPVSAPNSIQNRGFVVPLIQQIQLSDPSQAQAIATAIGIGATIFETMTMSTYPDPRHDSYDVVRWQGSNWLELSWSMDLIAGGTMQHTLRKAYS